MKKLSLILVLVLLVTALVSCSGSNDLSQPMDEKYVLYVGYPKTADDDVMKKNIHDICVKYVDGYTLVEGEGGFTNNGEFVAEETLIYTFCFVEKEKIVDLANEILEKVEGTNILFETQLSNAVHSTSEDFSK